MSKLPEVMPFERVDGVKTRDCYWRHVRVGLPRKGDWYISGAIPMAYRAPNDLSSSYMVVAPTHFAKLVTKHERGEMVPAGRRT
jgi:hypothetical protein